MTLSGGRTLAKFRQIGGERGVTMKMSCAYLLRLDNWITGIRATLQNGAEFFKIYSHSCFSWRTNVVYTAQGYAVAL